MAKDAIEKFKTKGHSTIKQTKTDKQIMLSVTTAAERQQHSGSIAAA